jgi:hypothetical protein
VDRRPAGRRRRVHGVPRKPHEGGRIRQLPQGHRRLPQAPAGAKGARTRPGFASWQRHR